MFGSDKGNVYGGFRYINPICYIIPMLCLLTNEQSRSYYIKNPKYDQKLMGLAKRIATDPNVKYIGKDIKMCERSAGNEWEIIEEDDKTFMIIWIDEGASVRAPMDEDIEYKSKDVNGKFIMIDGIEFRSGSNKGRIFYMEV